MGKTMIVAELSANHNHDFDLAVKPCSLFPVPSSLFPILTF